MLQSLADLTVPHGIRAYFKTEYLGRLTDAAIDTLLRRAAELAALEPICGPHVHHAEGAVAPTNFFRLNQNIRPA